MSGKGVGLRLLSKVCGGFMGNSSAKTECGGASLRRILVLCFNWLCPKSEVNGLICAFDIFSANSACLWVLCVKHKRANHLTQRTQRHAEFAEKIETVAQQTFRAKPVD